MLLKKIMPGWISIQGPKQRQPSQRRRPLAVLDPLEDRVLLTAYVVNTTSDTPVPGLLTLRQAIDQANSAASGTADISFDPVAFSGLQRIYLNRALPNLTTAMNISGPASPSTLQLWGGGSSTNYRALGVTYNGRASISISNITFAGFHSSQNGGAIEDLFGRISLSHCQFTQNSATSGGAISIGSDGGLGNNSVQASNCDFANNSASDGGAVAVKNGIFYVSDSTFWSNVATDNGGALFAINADTSVTGCTFGYNSAINGGALYNGSAGAFNSDRLLAETSTFVGNQAQALGGAIYHDKTGYLVQISLISLTVVGNSAYSAGGGLFQTGNGNSFSSSISLYNSIVAQNAGSDAVGNGYNGSANLIGNGTGMTGLYQGFDGNQVGTASSPINPLLAPLGNYGGPTQTMALLPGSPAIDAGTKSAAGTDQRGISRPYGSTPDIGAFESRGFLLIPISGSGQSTSLGAPFPQPLQVFVAPNYPTEPVAGGLITFTPPTSGGAAVINVSPATIGASNLASVTATANNLPGSYAVHATAAGTRPADFSLKNVGTLLPTITTLTSSHASSTYGNTVTFTAKVTSSPASQTPPGGTVQFQLNGQNLGGPVSLVDGVASLTTSTLNAARYSVTASYSGDAANFSSSVSNNLAQTVAPRQLVATMIGNPTKVYDGTPTAALLPTNFALIGLVGSDHFTDTQTTGVFNSKNVLQAASVVASLTPANFEAVGSTLAGNYLLPSLATGAGQITPKSIIGSVTVANKEYDGTTTASILDRTLNGLIAGDTVFYVGGTASFNDTVIGTNKLVTAIGLGLSGSDATNYSVNTTATTHANIMSRGGRPPHQT